MLIDSGLPKLFWGYALETAAYLHCRSPAAGLEGKTPYEKLLSRKMDPSMFYLFGCVAYALIPQGEAVRKIRLKGMQGNHDRLRPTQEGLPPNGLEHSHHLPQPTCTF